MERSAITTTCNKNGPLDAEGPLIFWLRAVTSLLGLPGGSLAPLDYRIAQHPVY